MKCDEDEEMVGEYFLDELEEFFEKLKENIALPDREIAVSLYMQDHRDLGIYATPTDRELREVDTSIEHTT